MANKKHLAIRTLAALYLTMLVTAAGFMFEWMFKLPTIKYHDYAKYYTMAKIVASDESHKFYDGEHQLNEWRKLSNEGASERPVCMEISPVWPAILYPFGKVSLQTAYLLWQGIWMSAGAIGLFSVLRSIHSSTSLGRTIFRTFILCTAIMASLPEARGMVLGQPSWLILGLLSGFCAAFLAKQDVVAGILLAISTIKFQYSPFFGVAALAAGRWKIIAVAAAGFFALLGAAAVIVGPDTVLQYPSILLKWETMKEYEIDINPQSMVNFRGVLSILMPSEIAMKFSFPIMIAGLLLTLKVWFDALKIGAKAVPWALSFSVIAVLLFSAHVHMYECIVLAICAALTFPSFDPVQLLSVNTWRMRLWIWLLAIYPFLLWVIFLLDAKLFHIQIGGMTFSVVTVFTFNAINIVLAVLAAINLYKSREAEKVVVNNEPDVA
ncbi:MAG TPA: DUF2029 domain-containing protein [Candidatus Melainabacteria bacterium]|nr:DUF2029 domain-containing protein [Candidatus Melainabacteria bacterium]HIN65744.1 DUF2029 domain-containing protein [Candidatus Obscuribacterales bacterium]